jgi:putative component of membrane protein insertase Oxa1/YidC/SpoIIIJ protein YidD
MITTMGFSKYFKSVLIMFITVACRLTGYGQVLPDSTSLKFLFMPEVRSEEYSTYLKNSETEMKVLVSFYYLIYKELISSQDVDACVFNPSCSTYTMEAIEKRGFIKGLLEGLDRLMRCHYFTEKNYYPYDRITMKYYDPY